MGECGVGVVESLGPIEHDDESFGVDGEERRQIGGVRPRGEDEEDDVRVEDRFGPVRRVEFRGLDARDRRLDGGAEGGTDGPAATGDLHPQRGVVPLQGALGLSAGSGVEPADVLDDLPPPSVRDPRIPHHDHPRVSPPILTEGAGDGSGPGRRHPEKTLWSLQSLLPHTPSIRDNGRVNDADLDTTETLEQGPTRGNRLYPRVTSFRSRRGALTLPQQESWDRCWPELGRDVGDDRLDMDAWFGRSAPVVLEIGSGTGTAAVTMARAEPHVNLVAVEVYKPGIAQTLQQIERTYDTDTPIRNLRILRGDAVEVLEHMVAPESLTGVRVFFPDPWPKARHHKRRLLQPPTFALIASRLQPGGVLHVATDHAEYAEAIAEAGNAEPLLTSLDWESPISHERPVTKFEDKAQRVGSSITELVWGKIRA